MEELLANVQMDFALLLPGYPNALVMGQQQIAALFFQNDESEQFSKANDIHFSGVHELPFDRKTHRQGKG